MILDLGEEAANTNMAGGPSDRRFSRWYNSIPRTGSTADTKSWSRLNRFDS